MSITPFTFTASQAQLDDLSERLAMTRWPSEIAGAGWSRGAPLAYVKELVALWQNGFDWRAEEARINSFPQFTTEIDGANVHFLHIKSPEANATPLLLIHSWPGSVIEFFDMIGPLTDPKSHGLGDAQAFDLVIPSIPGTGFSGPVEDIGWSLSRVGKAFAQLMARLGYARYGAQGGDAGAIVAREMALVDAEHIIGIHVLELFSYPSGDPSDFADLSPEDQGALAFAQTFFAEQGAFAQVQSTRPQALAYGMADSPAGLLGWCLQLFSPDETQRNLTPTQILTDMTIYWLTNTFGSSAQLYYEGAHPAPANPPERSHVPTGVAVFPNDFRTIRKFAERDNSRIVHWSEMERGGHFGAIEEPALLAADIRKFFGALTA